MKILLDNNLSPRLAQRLSDVVPEIMHVESVGLAAASDQAVWAYAKANGCLIATKDADFAEILILQGFPPKVVWLRLGNCTTSQLESLLRTHAKLLAAFEADPASGLLHLP